MVLITWVDIFNTASYKNKLKSKFLQNLFKNISIFVFSFVSYCVTSSLPHARRYTLNVHRSNKEYTNTWKKTRRYTWQ